MTVLCAPADLAAAGSGGRDDVKSERLLDAVVLTTVLAVLVRMTAGAGGQDRFSLLWGFGPLAVAAALVKPWRHWDRLTTLVCAPVVGGFVVLAAAPTAWGGGRRWSTLALAALLFVLVRAWAVTSQRRVAVVAVVVGAGVVQVLEGWGPWAYRGDVERAMIGTFFWKNQFGIFCAAASVCAVGLLGVARSARARIALVAAAAVTAAGTWLSLSRAAVACLALGWCAVGVSAYASRSRRMDLRAFGVSAAAPLAAVAVVLVLTSPLVVDDQPGAAGGFAATSDTFVGNGFIRLEYWKAAWQVFTDEPMTGVGFGGFGAAVAGHLAPGIDRVADAHNGPLELLAEGGLVLGIPVVLLLAVAVVGAARALGRGRSAVERTAAATTLVLLAHAAVDFDWKYPTLLCLLSVVAACYAPRVKPPAVVLPGRPPLRAPASAFVLMLALASAFAVRVDAAGARSDVPRGAAGVLLGSQRPFHDPLFDRLRLHRAADAGTPGPGFEDSLARTRRLADHSALVTWLRARALVAVGRSEEGVAYATAEWQRRRTNQPAQAIGYASVLVEAGLTSQALEAVDEVIAATIGRGAAERDLAVLLSGRAAMRVDDPYRCLYRRVAARHRDVALPPYPGAPRRPCSEAS